MSDKSYNPHFRTLFVRSLFALYSLSVRLRCEETANELAFYSNSGMYLIIDKLFRKQNLKRATERAASTKFSFQN